MPQTTRVPGPEGERTPEGETELEDETEPKHEPGVKDETRYHIETVVNSLPLHELRVYLQGRLVPEGWEPIEDETDEEMPESEEGGAFDVDDFEDDEEGDFSEVEEEEVSLLEVLENVNRKASYPQYADVVVKRLSDEIFVCSGSSHLLLHMGGDDPISHIYKQSLRGRVENTVRIAQQIVSLNKDYFLKKSEKLNLLARMDVTNEKLGLKEETVSRLVGSACLLTPWSELLPFEKFFMERATDKEVARLLLRVFARYWQTEHQSPLKDKQISHRVKDIGNLEKLSRERVTQVRNELGIPPSARKKITRKKLYDKGKNFTDILIDILNKRPPEKYDIELLLEQAQERESNTRAKSRLKEWREQIEKRCKKQCQS